MLETLWPGDRLLVSELSHPGRSLGQVIQIVEMLVHCKICFIAIKEGIEFDAMQDLRAKIMIALFGLFEEVERDLISERIPEDSPLRRPRGSCSDDPRGPWENPSSTARNKTFGRCWIRMSRKARSPKS